MEITTGSSSRGVLHTFSRRFSRRFILEVDKTKVNSLRNSIPFLVGVDNID